MVGGIPMAFALATDRFGKGFLVWMGIVAAVFEVFLALHAAHVLPFAPYVPTAQKAIIVSFELWQLVSAMRIRRADTQCVGRFVVGDEELRVQLGERLLDD